MSLKAKALSSGENPTLAVKKINNLKDLKSCLTSLKNSANELGFEDQVTRVKAKLNDLDDRVYVMVVGEGNFGKSTFINTFLGVDIAPVSIIPKTWKIDTFYTVTDKKEEKATLVFEDLSTKSVGLEEAREFNQEEEKKSKSDKNYESNLIEIKWWVQVENKGVQYCLIDTPGLGQHRMNTTIESIKLFDADGIKIEALDPFDKYFHKADIVLWCFKADKVNAIQSYEKIKTVQKFNKPIIGILTQMDKAPEDLWDNVLDQAKETFGKYVDDVIPSSAGKNEEQKELTFTKIKSTVNKYALEKGLKLKESLKALRIEQKIFFNRCQDLASFYERNDEKLEHLLITSDHLCSNIKGQLVNKIHQFIDRDCDSLDQSLSGIWRGVENQKNNRSDLFKARFESKLNDNTQLFRTIENEINVNLKSLQLSFKETFEKNQWEALNIGSKSTKLVEKNVEINLNFSEIRSNVTTGKTNITSSEGGDQILLGGIAAGIGMIALGPIGIAAGLVALFMNSEQENCFEKAEESIDQKRAELKKIIEQKLRGVIDNISSTVRRDLLLSFNHFTGINQNDVLRKLTRLDESVIQSGIWLEDGNNIIPKYLPEIKYYYFSERSAKTSNGWITQNLRELDDYCEDIIYRYSTEIKNEILRKMKSGEEGDLFAIETEIIPKDEYFAYSKIRESNDPILSDEFVRISIEHYMNKVSLDSEVLVQYKEDVVKILSGEKVKFSALGAIIEKSIKEQCQNIWSFKKDEVIKGLSSYLHESFSKKKKEVVVSVLKSSNWNRSSFSERAYALVHQYNVSFYDRWNIHISDDLFFKQESCEVIRFIRRSGFDAEIQADMKKRYSKERVLIFQLSNSNSDTTRASGTYGETNE